MSGRERESWSVRGWRISRFNDGSDATMLSLLTKEGSSFMQCDRYFLQRNPCPVTLTFLSFTLSLVLRFHFHSTKLIFHNFYDLQNSIATELRSDEWIGWQVFVNNRKTLQLLISYLFPIVVPLSALALDCRATPSSTHNLLLRLVTIAHSERERLNHFSMSCDEMTQKRARQIRNSHLLSSP